jgi:hypothetical protein
MMQIELKDVLIPLLSALAASGLTHVFTFRRTKSELLLHERVHAFSELHLKLVHIGRYCAARSEQDRGSDFALTTETLSQDENKSVLEHFHELRALQDRTFIYFPRSVQEKLKEVDRRLLLMCGHELRNAHESLTAQTPATPDYESLSKLIKETIDYVYRRNPLR